MFGIPKEHLLSNIFIETENKIRSEKARFEFILVKETGKNINNNLEKDEYPLQNEISKLPMESSKIKKKSYDLIKMRNVTKVKGNATRITEPPYEVITQKETENKLKNNLCFNENLSENEVTECPDITEECHDSINLLVDEVMENNKDEINETSESVCDYDVEEMSQKIPDEEDQISFTRLRQDAIAPNEAGNKIINNLDDNENPLQNEDSSTERSKLLKKSYDLINLSADQVMENNGNEIKQASGSDCNVLEVPQNKPDFCLIYNF